MGVSIGYDEVGIHSRKATQLRVATEYAYDRAGRLAQMRSHDGDKDLDSFTYRYDRSGNITRLIKERAGLPADSGTFKYRYDVLDRLVEARRGKKTNTYAYDSLGNRISSKVGGVESHHTYNELGQLIRTENAGQTTGYTYDARGNLSSILEGGRPTSQLSFDAAGMLESATTDKEKVTHCYNGLGRRSSTTTQTGSATPTETQYLLDLTRPFDDLIGTTTGKKSTTHLWGADLVCSTIGGLSAYHTSDHLGSPTRMLGPDGTTLASYAFDEFGTPLPTAQSDAADATRPDNPFGFTGYQPDAITGLDFAQARYYDARVGRFVSEDVLKGHVELPQSLNAYGYCWGRPLVMVDRDGLFPGSIHESITLDSAKTVGIPKDSAQTISMGNVSTDAWYSPKNPIIPVSGQPYHFNLNPIGKTDSRQQIAEKNLQDAVQIWNNADRIATVNCHTSVENERQRALILLGQGAHAIQDIEAHGMVSVSQSGWWYASHVTILDISPLRFGEPPRWFYDTGKFDSIGYVFGDDTRTWLIRAGDYDRYWITKSMTDAYLRDFASQTGLLCDK